MPAQGGTVVSKVISMQVTLMHFGACSVAPPRVNLHLVNVRLENCTAIRDPPHRRILTTNPIWQTTLARVVVRTDVNGVRTVAYAVHLAKRLTR